MTTTITYGTTTFNPVLLGFSRTRTTGNQVHDIPGSAARAVSLGVTSLPTGTLELGFITEASAVAAETALLAGVVFTLTDTTYASMGMDFVASGNITLELDDETLSAWKLSIDWQQV